MEKLFAHGVLIIEMMPPFKLLGVYDVLARGDVVGSEGGNIYIWSMRALNFCDIKWCDIISAIIIEKFL